MKLRIVKHYHRDTYRFKVDIQGSHDCSVNCNFKDYKGRISDDYNRVELIEPIHIEGIMGDHPKELTHLTINKYDVRCVQSEITGKY